MGRGQGTNKWFSDPSGNCAVSIVIKTKQMPANAPMIAALAIHKTISSYSGNLDAKVKWINDVFVSGKKISGVLVTCQNGQEKDQSFFKLNVGIGVNLNSAPFEGSICLKDVLG